MLSVSSFALSMWVDEVRCIQQERRKVRTYSRVCAKRTAPPPPPPSSSPSVVALPNHGGNPPKRRRRDLGIVVAVFLLRPCNAVVLIDTRQEARMGGTRLFLS